MAGATGATHTPGPWNIEADINDEGSSTIVTVVDGAYVVAECPTHGGYQVENPYQPEANARLIAAAPELLEACREAEAYIRPSGPASRAKHGPNGSIVHGYRTSLADSLAIVIAKAEARS